MKRKIENKQYEGFEKLVQENKIGRPFGIITNANKPGKTVISEFGKLCLGGIVTCSIILVLTVVV